MQGILQREHGARKGSASIRRRQHEASRPSAEIQNRLFRCIVHLSADPSHCPSREERKVCVGVFARLERDQAPYRSCHIISSGIEGKHPAHGVA